MEIILTIIFIFMLALVAKGAYHNYYVLNTFGYKSKKHELYLNKITSLLWKVVVIFILLCLIQILNG